VKLPRALPFLLAFVLPLVAVYAWWGGFNPVTVEQTTRPVRTYAYLEQQGDYSKLPELQTRVHGLLALQGITPGAAITLLYDDPARVPIQVRRARTGYVVADGAVVREPLALDRIEAGPVRVARVRAAARLAPSRAYQALAARLESEGRGFRMPTVEIFEASGSVFKMGLLSVEMQE